MAEERNDSREMTWRSLLPWTELFRGFQIALDPNKLFLAAIGIFLMAFMWWFLAFLFSQFYSANPPDFKQDYLNKHADAKPEEIPGYWAEYSRVRRQWNLMHRATGLGNRSNKDGVVEVQTFRLEDLVANYKDYATLTAEHDKYEKNVGKPKAEQLGPMPEMTLKSPAEVYEWIINRPDVKLDEPKDKLASAILAKLGKEKPSGELNTWPWFEERGPNPFMLVTGQAGRPWEAGHFWEWFMAEQLPVVIEPVVKLVKPLVFFFSSDADGLPAFYFFLVFVATVAIWSLVGGAITRIAAVQIARGEKIDFMEAVRFTVKRWASYLMAPVYPLAFILVMIIFVMIFSLIHMIPFIGDLFSGLLLPIVLLLGFVIALALVCLVVGWPLMPPTISTEGTDSWEALSRSFSYVFQKPFHYVWYALVAICYAAVLIFFIGFMGSFTVYLSKWAMSQTPGIKYTKRDPVYLFIYAPTSFGWRELLLKDQLVDGDPLVVNGKINNDAYERYLGLNGKHVANDYDQLRGWNKFAAGMVAFWLYLFFLLMIGFGYSLFWSLTTIIYFLLRRNVDAAEMDEVYLEEDEHDLAYSGPLTPPSPPTGPPKSDQPLTMVDSPTLRPSGPTTTPLPTSTTTAPPGTSAAPATDAAAGAAGSSLTEPAKPTTSDGNAAPP